MAPPAPGLSVVDALKQPLSKWSMASRRLVSLERPSSSDAESLSEPEAGAGRDHRGPLPTRAELASRLASRDGQKRARSHVSTTASATGSHSTPTSAGAGCPAAPSSSRRPRTSPGSRVQIVNRRLALGPVPAGESARTEKVYFPGFRCRKVFGDLQLEKRGLGAAFPFAA